MKEKRKTIVKYIEKEYIYVQNLVEVLAKKYHEELAKDKNNR